MVFPELFNSTNQSVEQVINVTLNYPVAASPDVVYLAPSIVILGFFLLMLYMSETRRDIGYAVFMALISVFAFDDTLLSSITYSNVTGYIPTLPFVMLIMGGYEVFMTLLLVNEVRNRELLGGDRDHGKGGGGNDEMQ